MPAIQKDTSQCSRSVREPASNSFLISRSSVKIASLHPPCLSCCSLAVHRVSFFSREYWYTCCTMVQDHLIDPSPLTEVIPARQDLDQRLTWRRTKLDLFDLRISWNSEPLFGLDDLKIGTTFPFLQSATSEICQPIAHSKVASRVVDVGACKSNQHRFVSRLVSRPEK